MDKQVQQHIRSRVSVLLLCFVTPLVLYNARHFDDNRLTSWSWVFAAGNVFRLSLLVGVGLLAAAALAGSGRRWRLDLIFVLSFLATVPFWKAPETIVDATRYFSQAKQLKIYGVSYFLREWGHDVFAWTDLPLVPMLYGLLFKVFGENRIGVQVLNSLFLSGTVMLTYRLGAVLWNEEMGRYAGLLLLGFPYLFTQVPLMLVDVPTMFFLMLAVYTFTAGLLHGGMVRLTAAPFAILLAFQAKYSVWLFFPLFAVIFFVVFYNTRQRVVVRRCAIVVIPALLLAGVTLFFFREVVPGQIELLTAYQKPGLKRWGESFFSTFFFQTHPLLSLAALFSFGVAFLKRDGKYLIICFLLVLLVLLQTQRARYTLPLFPMVALMASYGIMQLSRAETRRLLVAAIALTSLCISIGWYLPFLKQMSPVNLQQAAAYLDQEGVAVAGVVVLPQEKQVLNPAISLPLLDIYTAADLVWLPGDNGEPVEWDRVATSPLRFTWEYPVAAYYPQGQGQKELDGVVLISSGLDQEVPHEIESLTEQFDRKKVFNRNTGIFTFKTIVTVYH